MKVAIVGGGIAGLTLAIALKRKGIYATVYEAVPEIKPLGAGLALSANAIKAFDKIQLKEKVISSGHFLPSFTIYTTHGKIITEVDSKVISQKFGADNIAIHRAGLHKVLLNELDNQQIITGKRATRVKENESSISLFFDNGEYTEVDLVVAADGIHSPIRKQLMPNVKIRYAGYTCWRAVVDAGNIKLKTSSETWDTKGRFGMVALPDNKIYWFACINSAIHQNAHFRAYKVTDLYNHFNHLHNPIPQLIKQTSDDELIWGDIIDIEPIPTFTSGRVVLIGDAAHATTPNLGQGACQAIEDAVVLADELYETHTWQQAFVNFNNRRIKRTHKVVNTSYKIGKMAQLSNPALGFLRNTFLRVIPKRVSENQLKELYTVDF